MLSTPFDSVKQEMRALKGAPDAPADRLPRLRYILPDLRI